LSVIDELAGVAQLARQEPDEVARRIRPRVGPVVRAIRRNGFEHPQEARLLRSEAFQVVLTKVLHGLSPPVAAYTCENSSSRRNGGGNLEPGPREFSAGRSVPHPSAPRRQRRKRRPPRGSPPCTQR